jgi:hypothetical protein
MWELIEVISPTLRDCINRGLTTAGYHCPGRNRERFLLQTYRRDLGGGNFALMKDLSMPILVNGRHWGGLRLGYRVV